MNTHTGGTTQEQELLLVIGSLSDRLRRMRGDRRIDSVEIKALEGQSRAKWEELRSMRAGPNVDADDVPRNRGSYR